MHLFIHSVVAFLMLFHSFCCSQRENAFDIAVCILNEDVWEESRIFICVRMYENLHIFLGIVPQSNFFDFFLQYA